VVMHSELSTSVALAEQIMCSCSDLVPTIPNANYISALIGPFSVSKEITCSSMILCQ
jgi:hypothetical protein